MDEDQLLESIRERYAARGLPPPPEETVAEISKQVSRLLTDNRVVDMAASLKDGAVSAEMRLVNLSFGIQGGEGLFRALVEGAELLPRRADEILRELRWPEGLEKGAYGAMKLETPGRSGSGGKTFHLRCAPVGKGAEGSYSMDQELAKISPFVSEKDMGRVKEQVSYMYLFARRAYVEFLAANSAVATELATVYGAGALGEKALTDFMVDPRTSVLNLARPLPPDPNTGYPLEGTKRVRLSPGVAIFVDLG